MDKYDLSSRSISRVPGIWVFGRDDSEFSFLSVGRSRNLAVVNCASSSQILIDK